MREMSCSPSPPELVLIADQRRLQARPIMGPGSLDDKEIVWSPAETDFLSSSGDPGDSGVNECSPAFRAPLSVNSSLMADG